MINDEKIKILQKMELENLIFFKRICEENHLRYYLVGGTLIGVMRHQGFIPWDDDIDVAMPRPDYNKFLEIVSTYLPDNLEIKSKTSEPNFKCYFTRLINNKKKIYWNQGQYVASIGIWMDIFPVDGLPNNILLRYIHILGIYWYKMIYKFTQIDYVMTNKKRNVIETILIKFAKITRIGKLFSGEKVLDKIDKKLQKYDYEKSKYLWNYAGGHGLKEVMKRDWWGGKERTGTFEGMTVMIPEKSEEHLTYLFGDYMKLPPENERYTHKIEFVEDTDKSI